MHKIENRRRIVNIFQLGELNIQIRILTACIPREWKKQKAGAKNPSFPHNSL